MKIGVVFPTNEIGNDPLAIRDFAQAAEELGYSTITAYDHVMGAVHAERDPPLSQPGAYDETHPFHEPMVLFGYLAGLTEIIEFATSVLVLPQRQTVLVAKQTAEISVLSGGRIRLGVGSGWNYAEYQGLGVPFAGRGERLNEQIDLLRKLWTGEVISFTGEFHTIDRANILPIPVKPVPIYIGGFGPAAVRRAAAMGDGFTFGTWMAPELCEVLWEEMEIAGRKREGFGIETMIHYTEGPEKHRKVAEQWKHLGTTVLSVRMNTACVEVGGEKPCNYTNVQQYIDAMVNFKETVGDLL